MVNLVPLLVISDRYEVEKLIREGHFFYWRERKKEERKERKEERNFDKQK